MTVCQCKLPNKEMERIKNINKITHDHITTCWKGLWQIPIYLHDKKENLPKEMRDRNDIPKHNKDNILQVHILHQIKCRENLKVIPLKSGTCQGCTLCFIMNTRKHCYFRCYVIEVPDCVSLLLYNFDQ